jgi:hypothetical protein
MSIGIMEGFILENHRHFRIHGLQNISAKALSLLRFIKHLEFDYFDRGSCI